MSCLLKPPPRECAGDCETCPYHSPADLPYPCCACLRWESERMKEGTTLERWLKSELELYNDILHRGPADKYTPQGHKRLMQIHAIASRLATRLIQKKTLIEIDDPELLERVTHYTTLYDATLKYHTADDYDEKEDVLAETHQILHQLMTFLNRRLDTNYNLERETRPCPSIDGQIDRIGEALKNGERPRPCW